MKGVRDIELLTMIWIYSALRATSTKNRLALLVAGLRWIGILVFALLSGYFVTQDAYLESTISILTVWPGSRQQQKPWTLYSNAIRDWLFLPRLPRLQATAGTTSASPAASSRIEAASSPFRAASRTGKVPPHCRRNERVSKPGPVADNEMFGVQRGDAPDGGFPR